jgi:LCP family protein required for cell wall assembly
LTKDQSPEDTQYAEAYRQRGHFNVPLIAGIFAFAMLSLYAFAAMVTQIDDDLFPGNELSIPLVQALPGVEGGNDQDSAETIDERINILVLGLDQRLDDISDEPYRTDSVVIFTIDPFAKTAGAFSIPRDTLVSIPDANGAIYAQNRINVAYGMGGYTSLQGYPGGGPQLVMDTIDLNFGIPIDYYVVLNWANFIEIIDELGGIDVTITNYAYDPAYADCSFCYDVYPVEFVPGVEHMDGQRALAYARIRKSDDDFRRIERQQDVMQAVARKALSLGLLDVGTAKNLYGQYTQSVQTNIPAIKVPGLALLAKQVGLENLRTVSAADAMFPCTTCGPASILDWDPVKFEELKAQVFSDAILIQEYARVEVLNGTVVPELAGDFAGVLRGRGVGAELILVDEYADGLLYDTTIVIDVNSNANHTASKVAEWLGLPASSVISGSDARAVGFLDTSAEVIVVLGADVQLPLGSFAGTQTGG